MKLKNLMLENESVDILTHIFYENIHFFMNFEDESLNESERFDFTKTAAFKKQMVKKTCKYPSNVKGKNGTQITVDHSAIKTFNKSIDYSRFRDAVTRHLTILTRDKKERKAYHDQRIACMKAIESLYKEYQLELKKFNMENAKKGSDKDEKCNGAYCDLPGAEDIINAIKKHVTEFIDFLKKAYKGWKTMPVDIPVFESKNDELNWLITQNITYRSLINESNIELTAILLETNFNHITNTFEKLLEKANSETLKTLRSYIRQFNKLVVDVQYTIDDFDPKGDANIIKELTLKVAKYKTVVGMLDKKIARLANS